MSLAGEMSFPGDLDSWLCSRSHMASFAKQLNELGVRYVGICCGELCSVWGMMQGKEKVEEEVQGRGLGLISN